MTEKLFHGNPTSKGIAIAPAFVLAQVVDIAETNVTASPAEEKERLQQALATAHTEIHQLHEKALQRLGKEKAAIFEAHEMFLSDPTLLQQVDTAIEQGESAPKAWQAAFEQQAALLETLNDPIFSARAVDLRDVGQRVLRILTRRSTDVNEPDQPSIIVAENLTPSQTILLPKELTLGFCTVQGNQTSHVAILARGLGIPAVVGMPAAFLDAVHTGDAMLLDGKAGLVYLDPSAETLARYRAAMERDRVEQEASRRAGQQPAQTPDGRTIEIGANLGGNGRVEAEQAVQLGAEGVGLLRTEFLYMQRDTPPDEAEQVEAYRPYLEVMAGRPIIFRTVDIGGDKPLPYLRLPAEANPFLGKRGIRLSLANPDLFVTQLKAILRAGANSTGIKIMFPMVAALDEVRAAKKYLAEARQALEKQGLPYAQDVEVGIMVEIPAAAVLADVLAPEIDFFSIGTNDLSQYTMAADRTHPEIGKMADAMHPAVLRLIQQVVIAAHAAGIWVGICGELAGDALAAPLLLGLGVDELSMAPPSIPAVKAQIRQWRYEDAQKISTEVLKLSEPEEVRRYLRSLPQSKQG